VTTPDSKTTPATPDEIAAIYLRARDVSCPVCGYNRRDGITHHCPECRAPLDLIPDKHAPGVIPPRLTLACAIGTLVFSGPWLALSIRHTPWLEMIKTISRAFGRPMNSYQILDVFDFLQVFEVASIATATWFSAAAIRTFRKDKNAATRRTAIALLALTIGLQPFSLWNVYTAFFQ